MARRSSIKAEAEREEKMSPKARARHEQAEKKSMGPKAHAKHEVAEKRALKGKVGEGQSKQLYPTRKSGKMVAKVGHMPKRKKTMKVGTVGMGQAESTPRVHVAEQVPAASSAPPATPSGLRMPRFG